MILSDAALELLRSYRWPGNVRELRNVLERAVLLCDEDRIGVDQLVFGRAPSAPGSTRELRTGASGAPPSTRAPAPPPSSAIPTPPSSAPDDRERVLAALEQCGGNQTEAARLLGVTRRVLGYRLDKLGLRRPPQRLKSMCSRSRLGEALKSRPSRSPSRSPSRRAGRSHRSTGASRSIAGDRSSQGMASSQWGT